MFFQLAVFTIISQLYQCVASILNMINYIFSIHLQLSNGKWLSLQQETRHYVSGFPLGCCDHSILMERGPYCTTCQELMKSVGSHGSLSLPYTVKVMVWHFVSNSHEVMTALIVMLPSNCCFRDFSSAIFIDISIPVLRGSTCWGGLVKANLILVFIHWLCPQCTNYCKFSIPLLH